MPSFSGRIEAKMIVPTGGASVSATVPNGAGAVTATIAAGSYYLTAAGGVSSLLTTFQTALNAATNGYARTAAATASMLGYGTWTNGAAYLFQETSGNAAATYGSPATLTASGSPSYSNTGPGQGGDLAIGIDPTGTDYFDGGNVFNVTGTDDLIVAWVGKFSSAPAGVDLMISKGVAGDVGEWAIYRNSNTIVFRYRTSSTNTDISSGTFADIASGAWYVGIASIDRSTGKARVGVMGVTSGNSAISTDTTVSGSLSNTNTLRIGNQSGFGAPVGTALYAGLYLVSGASVATGLNANISTALTNFKNAVAASWAISMPTTTGLVSIGWTGYTTPTWSISFTSTTLRQILGFEADISNVTTTQTGTQQAKGLWFPDSPLNCDDHPSMAPEETDLRTTESPTGVVLGLCGNERYVHANVRYRRVPVDRIREASATYDNASLEVFFRDTQSGQGGISWFTAATPVQVYWSNQGTDTLLGADANSGAGVAGWSITGVSRFGDLARLSQEGWTGQFDVRFPRLVSST